MKITLGIFCLTIFLINPAQGQESEQKPRKMTESKSIQNLDKALREAKDTLGFDVIFPPALPDGQQLYAYLSKGSEGLIVSFSPDEKCQGEKYCSIGRLYLKPSGSPDMRKDMSGQTITEAVTLRDNIQGYYTPGHPMGDYWPPSLQWAYNNVLYDLWWNEGDREMLIEMANAAIHGAPPQKKRP